MAGTGRAYPNTRSDGVLQLRRSREMTRVCSPEVVHLLRMLTLAAAGRRRDPRLMRPCSPAMLAMLVGGEHHRFAALPPRPPAPAPRDHVAPAPAPRASPCGSQARPRCAKILGTAPGSVMGADPPHPAPFRRPDPRRSPKSTIFAPERFAGAAGRPSLGPSDSPPLAGRPFFGRSHRGGSSGRPSVAPNASDRAPAPAPARPKAFRRKNGAPFFRPSDFAPSLAGHPTESQPPRPGCRPPDRRRSRSAGRPGRPRGTPEPLWRRPGRPPRLENRSARTMVGFRQIPAMLYAHWTPTHYFC